MSVPLEPGTRAKDISVAFHRKSLSITVKGKQPAPYIEGELYQAVISDDCFWTLEVRESSLV